MHECIWESDLEIRFKSVRIGLYAYVYVNIVQDWYVCAVYVSHVSQVSVRNQLNMLVFACMCLNQYIQYVSVQIKQIKMHVYVYARIVCICMYVAYEQIHAMHTNTYQYMQYICIRIYIQYILIRIDTCDTDAYLRIRLNTFNTY